MLELSQYKKFCYKIYNKLWAYRDPSQFWSERGNRYDQNEYVTNPFPDDEWLLDVIVADNLNKILEVGCATGRLLTFVAQSFLNAHKDSARIDGIDFSQPMLDVARRKIEKFKLGNISLHLGEGQKLPFSDNSYDLVFTRGVLMHLKNEIEIAKVLKEMLRVSSQKVIIIEEICPQKSSAQSGFSPNGIAHWWDYEDIFAKLGLRFSSSATFQNKERLGAWILVKNKN